METVADVHARLHYDTYVDQLKQIKGVFTRIQQLQRNAKTEGGIRDYASFLQRSINAVISRQSAERIYTGAELTRSLDILGQHTDDLNVKLGLHHRLPESVSEWVMKWHPEIGKKYHQASEEWCERPCKKSMDNLIAATDALYASYMDGFK